MWSSRPSMTTLHEDSYLAGETPVSALARTHDAVCVGGRVAVTAVRVHGDQFAGNLKAHHTPTKIRRTGKDFSDMARGMARRSKGVDAVVGVDAE